MPVIEIAALNGRIEPTVETADAEVNVLNVLINGVWCDAQDVVPAGVLRAWEEKLIDPQAPDALRSVCPVPAFPSIWRAA